MYAIMKCRTGSGRISACGGNGYAGGGGGRVSIDVFSRHDDPSVLVHGERSFVYLTLVVLFPFLILIIFSGPLFQHSM